jgi:hypothetical protein
VKKKAILGYSQFDISLAISHLKIVEKLYRCRIVASFACPLNLLRNHRSVSRTALRSEFLSFWTLLPNFISCSLMRHGRSERQTTASEIQPTDDRRARMKSGVWLGLLRGRLHKTQLHNSSWQAPSKRLSWHSNLMTCCFFSEIFRI